MTLQLEDNRISLSTVGSKQSFLTEAFDWVEHRYESPNSEWVRKESPSFRRVDPPVCIAQFPSVAQGYWWLAPKHFEAFAVEPVRCKVRRRCDNCISQEWSLYLFVVLVTAHAWRLVETHFEFPTSDKSGPTAMSAKSAFQILTGLYSSVRRLSSEERMAKLSRLSP